jgi:hypothetical protein
MDLTVPRHRRPVQSRARRCELRQRFYAVLRTARPETFDDFRLRFGKAGVGRRERTCKKPGCPFSTRTANIRDFDPVHVPARCISHTRASLGI